jgi:hypothetical protein
VSGVLTCCALAIPFLTCCTRATLSRARARSLGLLQSEGIALLSAFLHVRERLPFLEPPVALVHLLGAWRVHLLDQEASNVDQETPRFGRLSGPLATPRQLIDTPL